MIAVNSNIFLDIMCLPVISNIYITEPKKTFVICPKAKIINVFLMTSRIVMRNSQFSHVCVIGFSI